MTTHDTIDRYLDSLRFMLANHNGDSIDLAGMADSFEAVRALLVMRAGDLVGLAQDAESTLRTLTEGAREADRLLILRCRLEQFLNDHAPAVFHQTDWDIPF